MKQLLTVLASLFLLNNSLNAQTIQLEVFASGFVRPVDIAHCEDDRLFIVSQTGYIWIVDKNGNKLPDPFLNIDAIVGSSGNEQGLLGLAFHPDYAQNGYFYLNYTNNSGDTRVSRFSVSATDPNTADPNSELLLLSVDQPYSNHNGGCLKFGFDGYLYIGLGDGGSGGDPQANGQNGSTFLGKMHRIDVDNPAVPYGIPPTNPFVSDPNTLDEIWAIGLRNPWRFSFDRLTGDLWIGDVGQDAWEEVDFQPAASTGGENYGWRCYEGNHVYNTGNCPPMSEMTFPIAEYANSGSLGCSVTGGFVYRGFSYPQLYGRYLYTDYCTGRLWSITPDGAGGWTNVQLADLINNQLVSFGENKNGELFAAGLGSNNQPNGNIYRVTETTEFWGYELAVDGIVCEGESNGSITITFNPNTPPATVLWNDGAQGPVRTNLPAGTYIATIIGANASIVTETVIIAPPTISLSGIVTDVTCTGAADGSIDLTLNGSVEPSTASWSDGSNDFDRTGLSGGDYTVTVTSAEGCVLVETFSVAEPFPTDLPVIGLFMDSVLQIGDVWEGYQWLLNGQPIAGANSPTYTATESGVYSVQVGSLGCTFLSNEITVTLTATHDIPGLTSVIVTPNPFGQSFQLDLTVTEPMHIQLEINDLQGKNYLTETMAVSNQTSRHFDFGQIPSGAYLLVLKNGKGERVERLVKL